MYTCYWDNHQPRRRRCFSLFGRNYQPNNHTRNGLGEMVKVSLQGTNIYITSQSVANRYQGRFFKLKIHGREGVNDDLRYDPETYTEREKRAIYDGFKRKIREARRVCATRKNIILYCNHGRTRSVVVAIGLIMKKFNKSYREAYRIVHSAFQRSSVNYDANWHKIPWYKPMLQNSFSSSN